MLRLAHGVEGSRFVRDHRCHRRRMLGRRFSPGTERRHTPESAGGSSSREAPGAGGSSSGFEVSSSGPIASSSGAIGVAGGTCPDPADAAACPSLGGQPAWVGCTRTTMGTNTGAFQSCTCFATETGEGAWACEVADASPRVPEASGQMTSTEVAEASVDAAADGAAGDGPNVTAGQCVLSQGVWFCGAPYGNILACPASLAAACSIDAGSCFVCEEGAGQTYGCVDGGWVEGLPTETGCSP